MTLLRQSLLPQKIAKLSMDEAVLGSQCAPDTGVRWAGCCSSIPFGEGSVDGLGSGALLCFCAGMKESHPQFRRTLAMILNCPRCKGAIAFDPALAGQQVSCPHCQGLLQMPVIKTTSVRPAPAAVVQPEPEPSMDFTSAEPSPSSRRREAGKRSSIKTKKSTPVKTVAKWVGGIWLCLMILGGIGNMIGDKKKGEQRQENNTSHSASRVEKDTASKPPTVATTSEIDRDTLLKYTAKKVIENAELGWSPNAIKAMMNKMTDIVKQKPFVPIVDAVIEGPLGNGYALNYTEEVRFLFIQKANSREFGLMGAMIDGESYTPPTELDNQPAAAKKTPNGPSSDSKLKDEYTYGFTEGTKLGFQYVSRFRNVDGAGAEVLKQAYLKTLSDLDNTCEELLRTYGQENKTTQQMLGRRDGLRKKLKQGGVL